MPNINGTPSVSDVMQIPTRWGGVANAGAGIAQYFAQQQQTIQQLQAQQASQLVQYKTYDQLSGGQYTPLIDKVLSQNPYGRRFVTQGGNGMGQALQGQEGQPGGQGLPIMGPMTGPMLPQVGMGGGAQLPSAIGMGSNPSALPGSSPMVTGGTRTFNTPFGPQSTQWTNPAAKFTESRATAAGSGSVAPSTAYGSKMAESQATANVGSIRDDTQFNQMAQTLKNIISLHGKLSNKGLAGSGPNEAFTKGIYSNIPNIPSFGSMNPQVALTNPESQKEIGAFTSSRNENMIKMQPQLTQQFGQAGSVRILDSLVQLAGGEIPSLATPHDQAIGQATGTLRSLYVIKKSSDAYAQSLAQLGQKMPATPEEYIQGITPFINQYKTSLSPQEEKELSVMTKDVTGQAGFAPRVPGQLPQIKPQQGNQQAALPKGVPANAPAGWAHYSPSTGKFYDSKGNVINAAATK